MLTVSTPVRVRLVLVLCVVLSGCFDVESRVALNADGSGTLAVTLRADPIFASAPQPPPRILEGVEGELTIRSEIVRNQYVHEEQGVRGNQYG
jgi:hypothetical protein